MELNFQLLCIGIVVFFVIFSLIKIYRSLDIDDIIEPIISGGSTILSIFVFLGCFKSIDRMITDLLIFTFKSSIRDNGLVHIVLLLISFYVIKILAFYILSLFNSLLFNSHFKNLSKKNPIYIFLVIVFGAIRGLIFIVLIVTSMVIYNGTVGDGNKFASVQELKIYKNLEGLIGSENISVVTNGVIENVSDNKIIYYNGITIDEGIKSNSEIDNKALGLVEGKDNDREKAKAIYEWIGKNISYDDEKATAVMELKNDYESGSIVTFKDKKGICFDYACLVTSMCKAANIKSRIIVGEAFNGSEYVSHAWNQVYLKDEGIWINIDATFYSAGDYFDNKNFNDDHTPLKIAGEY